MTDAKNIQRKIANLSVIQKETVIHVDLSGDGKRVDVLVRNRLPWLSRPMLKEAANDSRLLRNGIPIPAGRAVKAGDEIRILHPEPWEDVSEMDRIRIDILYEDEDILVLNKPPHVVVHPAGAYRYTTLLNALHKRYCGDRTDLTEDDKVPRLVHRIDKETSGVLVAAFTRASHSVLGKLFEDRDETIEKEYLALVEGHVPWDTKEIELPLGPSPNDPIRLRRAVVLDGQRAHTSVRVVERFTRFSLVRCTLHTGRQHQIRVHMQAEGFPLVGDHLYGMRDELREIDITKPDAPPVRLNNVYLDETVSDIEAAERIRQVDDVKRREYWEIEAGKPVLREGAGRLLISRCALHCALMAFPHPKTGAIIRIEAPLCPDMNLVLEALRRDGR